MAKVKITGHASGSGVITVTAPNTSTDRTLTLPDNTGSLLTSSDDLPAANITGTLPAISGASLTALNATELTSGTIPIARIADDAVTNAKMADNSVTSANYVDGSIDAAHLANGIIDNGKMAANSIDSAQYVDGSIEDVHLAAIRGRKNIIINGEMRVAQRGTSFTDPV